MNSVMHWCSMGGYGVYVWSTYGLVLMGLSLGIMWARRQHNRVRYLLKQWFSRVN